MSKEEKETLVKQQALCEKNIEIPYIDMTVNEFCKQYGYCRYG